MGRSFQYNSLIAVAWEFPWSLCRNPLVSSCQSGRRVLDTVSVHVDSEIRWFYGIVAGLSAAASLLPLTKRGGLGISLVGFGVVLIILLVGWPLSARVLPDGTVRFRRPLGTVTLSSRTLRSMRVANAGEWGEHLVLAGRGLIPVGYRQSKFSGAAELATAVLSIAQGTPSAKIDPRALTVLKRTTRLHP